MRLTCARVCTVLAFAGLLCSPAALAPLSAQGKGGANEPRLAQFNGLTAGEWLALWWQDATATPLAPEAHGNAVTRKNAVRILGAPLADPGTPTITVEMMVAPGTPLFLPIITVECSVAEEDPFHGENEAELRACANDNLDHVHDLYLAIDGVPVADPYSLRVESPIFRYGPLPEDNFIGLPAGTQSDSVATGYAALLQPLSVGEHRIDVRATVDNFPVIADVQLVITVVPPGKQK